MEFTVDAGRAGFGNLELAIKDADGVIIPSHVSQLETGIAKFLVTFNPSSSGDHSVNITFNKEVLRGSPYMVVLFKHSPLQINFRSVLSIHPRTLHSTSLVGRKSIGMDAKNKLYLLGLRPRRRRN